MKNKIYGYIIVVLICCFLSSCGQNSDGIVGNLNDFSYSNGRGKTYGPNALGRKVGLEQFKGKFIWVDYASPWCSSCPRQAKVMQKIKGYLENEVIFLTVISGDKKPTTPATEETAAKWAKRFNLDPKYIVAEGASYRIVPQHAFFSPLGQTLYRKESFHTQDQIKSVISAKREEWGKWHKRQGE